MNRSSLHILLGALALAATFMASGCSLDDTDVEHFQLEPVVLVDVDGKLWDVSHAVYHYGFDVDEFGFGSGIAAFPPLIDPVMLGPTHADYPPDASTFDVIGTTIGGKDLAYGRFRVELYEVVDQKIGHTPIAVTY